MKRVSLNPFLFMQKQKKKDVGLVDLQILLSGVKEGISRDTNAIVVAYYLLVPIFQ